MATTLAEGQKAPAFSGKDQNGNKISLSDFKGKKVALYFYPEDDTPTCTEQACNLRDNFSLLKKEGIHNVRNVVGGWSKIKELPDRFEIETAVPAQ